jgi:threonine/homoserine/homoserine lactone efflux protein
MADFFRKTRKGQTVMIIKGFRFGLLLQVAIGPVCLFIIKTAAESGIVAGIAGVLAATFIDAVFVILAIAGLGALLEKPGVKTFLKSFGTIMLIYFGLGIILGSFGVYIIPSFNNSETARAAPNAFIICLILTASNPLTILFWTGVFAAKITGDGYGKREMILFGTGAVLATSVFLGIMALIVGWAHWLMPEMLIKILNAIVGMVLIGFGIRMALKEKVIVTKPSELHKTS